MKIPLLIVSHNRPRMLKDMVTSIEQYTDPATYQLIVCDNHSTQPEAIAYLSELEQRHRVLHNPQNLVFEGLNVGLRVVQDLGSPYFLISDPDLKLGPATPSDWIVRLSEILDKTAYPKAALALDASYAADTPWKELIKRETERSGLWKHKVNFDFIEDDCYEAPVDTTMALYRRDTFNYWNRGLRFDREHGIEGGGWINLTQYNPKYKGIALRVAGRFTCEHLGWWFDPKYLPDFAFYYEHSAGRKVASTLQKNIVETMLRSVPEEDRHLLTADAETYPEFNKLLGEINNG